MNKFNVLLVVIKYNGNKTDILFLFKHTNEIKINSMSAEENKKLKDNQSL